MTSSAALVLAGALHAPLAFADPSGSAPTPSPVARAAAVVDTSEAPPAGVPVAEAAQDAPTTRAELLGVDTDALEPGGIGSGALAGDAAAPGMAPSPDDVRWHELLTRVEVLEARLAELEAAPTTASVDLVVPDEGVGAAKTLAGPVVVEADEVVSEAVSLTGRVDVYGRVLGNAVGMGADVHVHPGGRVDGDAVSLGGSVKVDPGGAVGGDRVALGGEAAAASSAVVSVPDFGQLAILDHVRDLARRLAVLLSFAGAGVLVVGFWPRQVDHVARLVTERPLWYGLAGFILTGLIGVGGLVLVATVIGIPLAMLLVLALTIGALLGFVGLGRAIGDRFPGLEERGRWVSFLGGAALLTVLSFLPYVGPVLLVLLALPALGAALISGFGTRGAD